MKTIFLSLVLISGNAVANDVYVVSNQPRFVTTYQQQCEQVQVYRDSSTLGSVIGSVAGGLLGNTIGSGAGNTAATIAGAVIGGSVGNSIGSDQGRIENRQICRSVPVTVQQGEIVTFSYRGRTFTQIFQY
jgi:outer membrane lipoprotein SlyB